MRQWKKTWSTRWNGHTIVVENWFDWGMNNGENVFVDGDLVCEHESAKTGTAAILEAEIHDESGAHQLRVQVGTSNGVSINCHIFVDDELVGGDTEKKLILPAAPAQPLSVFEQKKQQKHLKHELFYRAVVTPLIFLPLCDMIELYFLNHNSGFVLAMAIIMLMNVVETCYKLFKISHRNSTDNPQNSTPV